MHSALFDEYIYSCTKKETVSRLFIIPLKKIFKVNICALCLPPRSKLRAMNLVAIQYCAVV